MESRSGHTPMDFEYDNGVGHFSADSPFPRHDPTKSFGFAGASEPQKSPVRSNSQLSAPSVRLPQTPSRLSQWRESDMGFSTDNQSSPENADNEETPDVQLKHLRKLGDKVAVERGRAHSPSKPKKQESSRRESLLNGIDSFTQKTGEMIVAGPREAGRYLFQGRSRENAIAQRKRKRSRREFDRDNQIYRRDQDYAEWDDSRPSSREGSSNQQVLIKEIGTIPAIFSFIHNHPNLPHILSYYGQMALSWALVMLTLWCIWIILKAVGAEVDIAVDLKASDIARENGECLSLYTRNSCGPEASTPPALWRNCREWQDCYSRDPQAVGRGSVSATTFAHILNSFVEPMSWKLISTIVFVALMLFSIPRALFGALSKKHDAQLHPVYPPPPPQLPPGQYMESPYPAGYQPHPQQVFFTPQHQRFGDALGHDMSPSRENMSPSKIRPESPSKRITYQ